MPKENDRPAARPPRGHWRTRLAAKLLLLGFALVVSFFLGELVVRVAKPGYPGFRVPQAEHKVAPGLGFDLIPSQTAYTLAQTATINAYGCRGPEIRPDAERRPTDLRVLCLGDSITYGYGVADDKTYPAQLEAMLKSKFPERRPEAINAGVQRYSIYQYLDWLRVHGIGLHPDIVTLGVYYNDLVVRPPGNYTFQYDNEREQAVTAYRNKWPGLYLASKNSALIQFLYGYTTQTAADKSTWTDRMFNGEENKHDIAMWKFVRGELEAFREIGRQEGFLPVVLTITRYDRDSDTYPKSFYPGRVVGMCDELGLNVVNMREALEGARKNGTETILAWDSHLNPTGCGIVAEQIAQRLEELLPQVDARRAPGGTPAPSKPLTGDDEAASTKGDGAPAADSPQLPAKDSP